MKRFATALLAACLAVPALAAKPITFCGVCPGYMISKKGNDVLIRCPGEPLDKPWMTFKDCKNPKVTRTPTMVTINCTFG